MIDNWNLTISDPQGFQNTEGLHVNYTDLSDSVPAHVGMMGLIGSATVAVVVVLWQA